MISKYFTAAGIAMVFAVLFSCSDKDLSDIDCSNIASTYSTDIKPIISNNCTLSGCHAAGSPNGDFTTYTGLKSVADNGKLNEQVIIDKKMPPSGPLSLDDRKKIKCWLNNGAPNN